MARHGAGDGVEVGGPAAAGFELVRRAVEGGVAGCALLFWKKGLVEVMGYFSSSLTDDLLCLLHFSQWGLGRGGGIDWLEFCIDGCMDR